MGADSDIVCCETHCQLFISSLNIAEYLGRLRPGVFSVSVCVCMCVTEGFAKQGREQ